MVLIAEGRQGRTIIARLQPGQDLMRALEQLLLEKEIKAGYIPVLQGGLKQVRPVSMTFGEQDDYPQDIEVEYRQPLEYLGMGTIARIEEKPSLHLHLTAGQTGNKSITGHFVEGQIVLVTEVVIVELLGVEATREADPEVFGLPLLRFH